MWWDPRVLDYDRLSGLAYIRPLSGTQQEHDRSDLQGTARNVIRDKIMAISQVDIFSTLSRILDVIVP